MKFLFWDKVKVIGGFYQGIEGIVTDYSGVDNKYYFEGCKENDFGAREMRTWINEAELVKAEE
jgi:hypothetical protein